MKHLALLVQRIIGALILSRALPWMVDEFKKWPEGLQGLDGLEIGIFLFFAAWGWLLPTSPLVPSYRLFYIGGHGSSWLVSRAGIAGAFLLVTAFLVAFNPVTADAS